MPEPNLFELQSKSHSAFHVWFTLADWHLHMVQRVQLSPSVCCAIRFASKQQGGKDGSFQGPKCNQLMRFESLAPMLAHAHTRSHMAEVWSGEIRDPHKVRLSSIACMLC